MNLGWQQVLDWRMRRQFLDRPTRTNTVDVVRRLAGVQAQVPAAAEIAVAVRVREPQPGAVERALAERTLVRTWAMRGTLHAIAADQAASFLALIAAARTWEKGAWQRAFATADQMAAITDAVPDMLEDRVLTREELVAEVVTRTGDESLGEPLRSAWGAVLKPLAWQGYLCNGPPDRGRVTFTSPKTWLGGWTGLPEPAEAAAVAIPAYLGAYGPASMDAFDQWLIRGASRKAELRSWFAGLGDELVTVEVDGEPLYARAADVDEIASARPLEGVRLLGAFDQYVLGPGTKDVRILPAKRRGAVSQAAGRISPVVLAAGRVVGTWQTNDSVLEVTLFEEAGTIDVTAIEAEAARLGRFLGAELATSIAAA